MANIMITSLYKSFGEKQVLRDFSACLPSDGTTALMGASGVGKTTLVRLLLGLEKPDGGSISGLPDKIAAVFQEDRLLEWATAAENLRFALGKISSERIHEGLCALGLGDSLSLPMSAFSGGMRRRVAILRALYSDATFLILDEPFKGLDEATRQKVAEHILANRQGRGILLITHDKEEAALLGASQWIQLAGEKE